MGLLTPSRRVYHRWRSVLPVYDGRSCPDCGAVICGREDRRKHREWHMAAEAWQEWAQGTIRQIAIYAGMTVLGAKPLDQEEQGDGYDRVDLRTPEYDDDDLDEEEL